MIAVLTALEVEYAAVREHLTGVESRRHKEGTRFEIGALAGHPHRKLALTCVGAGNVTAAVTAERVVAEFAPSALMSVGVAGALRDWVRLGDVVVATRVYAYEGGRTEGDEFLVRPRAWDLAHHVEQTVRTLTRSFAWRESLPDEPVAHLGPVAAGEVVHNSRTSDLARRLHTAYNDAIAVDMESAGLALAGHLNGSVPVVTVRAVSDRADGAKAQAHQAGWHPVAARNAAAFAVALAAALDDRDSPDTTAEAARPVINNRNIAKGNARVGQQTGVVFGDFHAGHEPTGGHR
jgi:adenosylhomocysteine nucleosidase